MNLEISIECGSWDGVDVHSIVDACVSTVFEELDFKHNNVEICFLFTSDEEVRLLNKNYRGLNEATNVLSFPTNLSLSSDFDDNGPVRILGSIALAHQTIMRESLGQKKPFEHHLNHMIVHGMLHLLGFDHAIMSEAEAMEALEGRILAKLNIPNPYQ
jgi:probable rRNA maturation factor